MMQSGILERKKVLIYSKVRRCKDKEQYIYVTEY